MKRQLYYLETGSQDPYYNLAFEEYVLTHRNDGDYLLLWQNDRTIVVGQNQNTVAEIDSDFVETRQLRVVRRTTGGGAVYHDLGNLNYSFITDVGDASRISMECFTAPVVEALRGLGVRAEASGRNDLLVEGHKVSGTAQRLVGKRILHHGTLLFDSNLEMLSGALRADPEKFSSKATKSVRSRVGNIRALLPRDMELTDFWAYLKGALSSDGLVQAQLTDKELAEVQRLCQEKYRTWEWNYGRSPQYELRRKHRWDGGTLEADLCVRKGCIEGIRFFGDFLSACSTETVEQALTGTPFRRTEVERVLAQWPLQQYFGGITAQEVAETLFGA